MTVTLAVNLTDGPIANADSLLNLRDSAEIVFVTPKKRYELQDIQLTEIDKLDAKLQSNAASKDGVVFHVAMDELLHSHAVEYIKSFYTHNSLDAEMPDSVRSLFVSKAEPEKVACDEITYLVSCIVPIYNGEKFLSEAIDSVIGQSVGLEHIQLILVNDGSNDGSERICKEYAEKYPSNVIYISQANSGADAARNMGLDIATGSYITFLNADDFFELNYMEECLALLQGGTTNFVAAQVSSLNEGLILNNNQLPYICKIPKNATFTQQSNSHYIFKSISGAMFSANLVGDVRFNRQSAPFAEGFFVLDILLKSESKFLYAVINNTGIVKRDLANKQIDIQSLAFLESVDLYDTLCLITSEVKKHIDENNAKTSFVQWSLLGNLGLYQGLITPEAILLNKDIFDVLENFLTYFSDNEIAKISGLNERNRRLLASVKKARVFDAFIKYHGQRSAVITMVAEEGNAITICGYTIFDIFTDQKLLIIGDGAMEYSVPVVKLTDSSGISPVYKVEEFQFKVPLEFGYSFDFYIMFPTGNIEKAKLFFDVPGENGGKLSDSWVTFTENCYLQSSESASRKNYNRRFCVKKRDEDFLRQWTSQAIKRFSVDEFADDIRILENFLLLRGTLTGKKIGLFVDEPKISEDRFRFLFSEMNFEEERAYLVTHQISERTNFFAHFGNVILYGSDEHKVLSLVADYYVSIDGHDGARFPFDAVDNLEIRSIYNSLAHGRVMSVAQFIQENRAPYADRYFAQRAISVPDTELVAQEAVVESVVASNGGRYFAKHTQPIGFIADEFLYDTWKDTADMVMVTPQNWTEAVEKISVMIISTVWKGLNNEWLGVGKNNPNHPAVITLNNIIAECNVREIPVVFYSKEDPPNYLVFIEIAKKCDHVFTTCVEVIDDYRRDCGHNRVWALPFSSNPLVHNPIGMHRQRLNNSVIFAGSWMKKYPVRCAELSMMFDGVLDSGYDLAIIDRNSHIASTNYRYPIKFFSSVRPKMEHLELLALQARYNWVINVNSVKDSYTMFANRLYELEGMGSLCISNYSKGAAQLLPFTFIVHNRFEIAQILGSMTPDEVYERQISCVRHSMTGNTAFDRFATLLENIGRKATAPSRKVAVVCDDITDQVTAMFNAQTYEEKELLTVAEWEARYDSFEMTAFFSSNMNYKAFYLEDMINGFKYTDCPYITKDSFYIGTFLVEGVQHGYVNIIRTKYQTVFWNDEFSSRQLRDMQDNADIKGGYSIDCLNFNKVSLEGARGHFVKKPYKLSVVVPICDNGLFMYGRTFPSLRRSSLFEDMEIILLDTGSTDKTTLAYIEQLAAGYTNVNAVFIDDSDTSNDTSIDISTDDCVKKKAMDIANGEYVTFLEPGNEIINDGLAMLYTRATEVGCDVTIGNAYSYGDEFDFEDNFTLYSKGEGEVSDISTFDACIYRRFIEPKTVAAINLPTLIRY